MVAGILVMSVAAILVAQSRPRLQPLFRWLPVPLWCYGVPMLLRAFGVLPATHPVYGWITTAVLPPTLCLLVIGLDVTALRRVGRPAGIAMLLGVASIVVGGPLLWLLFQRWLPAESWKGVGALAGTWTGGSLNMVALRAVLDVPDAIFAPLVVVDALIAYAWMACLMACKSVATPLDRWLRANPLLCVGTAPTPHATEPHPQWAILGCLAVAIALAMSSSWIASAIPISGIVTSRTGWTIVLVTTGALLLSGVKRIRRVGRHGAAVGAPLLYVVLAALGAQANLEALAATPIWILFGACWVLLHGIVLLVGGRVFRLPLSLLATVSQANVGGVISAPLVGAVYHPSLVAIGLLLALAANAVGTYLGMMSAMLCRWWGA